MPWETVHIPFAAGIQQAADERALEPPALAVCKNARFTELGGIQKRHSFSPLVDLPNAGADAVKRLAVLDDELIAFTSDKLYSYSAAEADWKEIGDFEATSVAETAMAARRAEQDNCDQAVLDGVRVVCWRDSYTNVWLAAYDAVTGALLAGPYEETGGTSEAQLLAMDDRILFTVVDSNTELKYKMLLPSNIDSSTSNEGLRGSLTSIDTDLTGGAYAVGRHPSSDSFVIVTAQNSTGGIRLRSYTAGSSGAATLVDNEAHNSLTYEDQMALAVCGDGRVCVIRADGTTPVADIFASDLTASSTGNSLGRVGGGTSVTCTVAFEQSASGGEYTAHYFGHYEVSDYIDTSTLEHNTVDTTGATGTVAEVHNEMALGSHAFATAGDIYVWTLFDRANGASGGSLASGFKAALQNTYFLVRASDYMPIAKACPGYAAGSGAQSLPRVQSIGGSQYAFMASERRRVPLGEVGSTGYEESGPRLVTVDLDTDEGRRWVQAGRTMYVAGGQVHQVAGGTVAEVGFPVFPWDFGIATTGGSLSGTFAYKAYWRWNNGAGEFERSTTATYVLITLSSQDGQPAIKEWLCSRKGADYGNDYPAIEIWRTQDNAVVGAPMYLVTSLDPSSSDYVEIDGTGARTNLMTDSKADSALISAQVDPHQGVLEPIAPPPAKVITTIGDRVLLAGIAQDPNSVWYSMERGDGEVAAFSDVLVATVPSDGGIITALAALNETLVVFCERATYTLPGSGFDNAGGGQNYGPARTISNDVGAVSHEAVAVLPDGVIFKSEKGWHLLNRGWQVSYIGGPVEDYDSETVNGITLMPDKHEVRIATSGRMLVWNTRANAWSEWEFTGGVTSTVLWRGQHIIATNSGASILQDDEDYSNVDYSMDIETAWIKLDGLQGFSRARFLRVLGEYRSAHNLRVRVARNYRKSGGDWDWFDDKSWTAVANEAGDALRMKHRLTRQRFEALKVRLTDVFTPTGDGEPEVLESGADPLNQTSYTTSAFTPDAEQVIYCAVATAAGSAPNIPTLSGHGTWVQVGSVTFDSARRVTLFRTKTGTSPSSSAITFDFSGQTQFHGVWAVLAPQNPVLSGTGGADSIGNTDTDSALDPTPTVSTDLSPLDDSETSGHLAVVYQPSGDNATATGFTEVANVPVTSPNMELSILWATGTAAAAITTNASTPGTGVVSAEVKRLASPTGEALKLTGLSLEFRRRQGLPRNLSAASKQ